MSDDTEQLIVQLEAKVDNFEKQMRKAAQTADTNFGSIEKRAKSVADNIGKSLEGAANGVGGIFSKISGSFLGAAGISGAGLAGILATVVSVNSELAKLPGLAKAASVSTDKLQEIKFAANLSGLSDSDFASGLKSAVALLDEAQRQTNSLKLLFNANGLSINDQNGKLKNFDDLLADVSKLMVNARTEQEKIDIAHMVGLTDDWVRVLGNGPSAFKAIEDSAKEAGAVIDESILKQAKEFDVAWNQAIVRFKAGFLTALTDIEQGFLDLWEKLKETDIGTSISSVLRKNFGGIKDLTIPELQEAIADNIRRGIGGVDYLNLMAELDRKMKEAAPKSPALSLTVNPAEGPPPEDAGKPTVIPREHEKNPFERAVEETNKRIAATQAETATIGQNSEVRQRAETVARLQEAAMEANTRAGFQNATVTDEQKAKIEQLADAMQAAAAKARIANQAYQGIQSAASFAGNEAIDVFDKLITRSATFAQSMQSVAQAIEKALLQSLLLGQGPLAQLLGSANSAGGAGGLVGSLISAFKPVAAAEGGFISGPGTSTSDSIPARLSAGEFVVNAAATSQHRGALEAINAGVRMPRFADGGPVAGGLLQRLAPAPAQSGQGGGGDNHVAINVINNSGGDVQTNTRRENGVDVHEVIISKVGAALAGGRFDQAMRGRFGTPVLPKGR